MVLYVISQNYAKIKVDSNDSLPLEKERLFITLQYLSSQVLIKMKITTSIIYSLKKLCTNYELPKK